MAVLALLTRVGEPDRAAPAEQPLEQLSSGDRALILGTGRGPLSVRALLQLHRALLAGTGASRAGLPGDAQRGLQLTELVARYELAVSQGRHSPLLLACALVLDVAAIEPFETGNERMAQLVLLRELLRHGHDVRGGVLPSASAEAAGPGDETWPFVERVLEVLE